MQMVTIVTLWNFDGHNLPHLSKHIYSQITQNHNKRDFQWKKGGGGQTYIIIKWSYHILSINMTVFAYVKRPEID